MKNLIIYFLINKLPTNDKITTINYRQVLGFLNRGLFQCITMSILRQMSRNNNFMLISK